MIDIYYSRTGANSFIVYNDKLEGFIVDPGFNPPGVLINHINKLNVKIVGILITHGHYDHIHALEEVCSSFPDAITYIHEEEAEFLTNLNLNLSIDPELTDYGVKKCCYLPKHLIKVTDNEMIHLAGFNIKVIFTPFHTKGSICYYLESENALFSGDSLFFSTIGRTDLPTGSNRTVQSSLLKIKSLPDGIKVYPGHGACTSLDREKKYNSYLKNI